MQCQHIKSRPEVTLSGSCCCRNGTQSVSQVGGFTGQLKQTDAAYIIHKIRRQKWFFISVGMARITLEHYQPTECPTPSFIVTAIKQINYLEMVILHASPVESLCKHHCGSLAVPGAWLATLHLYHCPMWKGKGNLSPFDASAPAEVSRHAMLQGVCSLPWCLTEPCSICIVLPHG